MLLRRLSVFAGGWTLGAAETICSGDGAEASDILDVLTQLVGKSLVMVSTQGGEARYTLLETVRQFGRDKLQESGEADNLQRRHRDWYLDFAERADPKLHGHEQDVWLTRLETEHDNLRAALAWSKNTTEGVDRELRLAIALGWFWRMNGDWSEGRRWLEDMLSAGRAADPKLLLKVVGFAGMFAYVQGDIDRMSELVEKRRALLEKVGGEQNATRLRIMEANLAIERGEVERAIPLHEEAVAIARGLDDKWELAHALQNLAEGVRIQGAYPRAARLCTESIKLFEEMGDRWRVSLGLRNMGIASLRQHDYDNAATFYADSIRLRDPAKNRFVVFQGLEGLACIACARGQYLRAARLFGAAKPIHDSLRTIGIHIRVGLGRRRIIRDPDYQVEIDQYVKATRTSLGEQGFSAASAEGGTMTLGQAVEYALASAELEGRAAKQQRASRPKADPLTARECDVARLVARGLTNREIATTLVVSNRTAEAHVQNIRNKLGFNSRAQIAAWAAERGLGGGSETESAGLQTPPSQVRPAT
jgi:non-specific serine/threonine protein kinase